LTGCSGVGTPRTSLAKPIDAKTGGAQLKPPDLTPFPTSAPISPTTKKPEPVPKPNIAGTVREVSDDGPAAPNPLQLTGVAPVPFVDPIRTRVEPAAAVFDETALQKIGERLTAGLPAGSPTFRFSTIRNPRPQILLIAEKELIVSTGMLAELRHEEDLARLLAERMAESIVERRAAGRPVGGRQPAPTEIAAEAGGLLARAGFRTRGEAVAARNPQTPDSPPDRPATPPSMSAN
jgi:hypothetical protein